MQGLHALSLNPEVQARALDLFAEQHRRIAIRTDRMFGWLMLSQWLAGVVLAVVVSPRAWEGMTSHWHPHVWAAVLLGGVIASLPVALAFINPGQPLTRHVVACGQMLTSALLIHLSGGRIETHFHVFGSLAFLAFYRDWRVLVTATAVTAVDHFLRGMYWPESVFGVLSSSPWRWTEHAAWVVFENSFLVGSIRQSLREMHEVAMRQAVLEETNRGIERQVSERTADLTQEIAERKRAEMELRAKHAELQVVHDSSPLGMARTDARGHLVYANRVLLEISGLSMDQMLATGWQQALHAEDRDRVIQNWTGAVEKSAHYFSMHRFQRPDGQIIWVSIKAAPIHHDQSVLGYVSTVEDITERKRVEAELNSTNRKLIDTSRQAGMAEVATAVLHNVGNVLNSVNVSSSLISNRIKGSKLPTLSRALQLVRDSGQDLIGFMQSDPRGGRLGPLLDHLGTQLISEQSALITETECLHKNIEHIKDIVAMQQSYARVSGVMERVQVHDLVQDAISMNGGGLERHQVSIVQNVDVGLPEISTDKHKVLQILINLIRNAKYACAESAAPSKEVILRAWNSEGTVKISVKDNGIGIPRENLTKIFNHGFTTRADGHGFGLHSGALAAKELGGALMASSEGPNRGATFTLELPIDRSNPEHENSVPNTGSHSPG